MKLIAWSQIDARRQQIKMFLFLFSAIDDGSQFLEENSHYRFTGSSSFVLDVVVLLHILAEISLNHSSCDTN